MAKPESIREQHVPTDALKRAGRVTTVEGERRSLDEPEQAGNRYHAWVTSHKQRMPIYES